MWRPSAPDAEAEHAYRVSGLRNGEELSSFYRRGSPICLSPNAVAGKTLQFRVPAPQLVNARDHAPTRERFAFPITMTRRHLGNGRRTLSTFEVAGGRYKGHYSAGALADWAKRIKSWKSQGCDVFVFFDNDQKSAAPIDALKLKQSLRPAGALRRPELPGKEAIDKGLSHTGISDDPYFSLAARCRRRLDDEVRTLRLWVCDGRVESGSRTLATPKAMCVTRPVRKSTSAGVFCVRESVLTGR
jgi:hypothetical protein